MQLSNWGTPPGSNEAGLLFSHIKPGDAISLDIGLNNTARLFEGEITAIEELYGEGAPQLIIMAEDKLHKLARIRYSNAYEDMSIDDIIQSISAELNVSTDINVSSEVSSFNQINESHLACLLRIGERFNVHLRLEDNTLRMRPEEDDTDLIEYHVQRDIESIRFMADLNHQSKTTRSYGWNLINNESTQGSSHNITSGQSAKTILEELSWGNEEITPQPFPMSQIQAENYAQAQYSRQAQAFVSARMSCIGDERLSSGKQIKITGGSPRFNGVYRIMDCLHQFDRSNGYQCQLLLQKPLIEEPL